MRMQKLLLLAALLIITPCLVHANEHYPNASDDAYVYQADLGGEITDTVINEFNQWKQRANVGGFTDLYVRTSPRDNMLRVYSNGRLSTLADFDDPVGTKYNVYIDGCNDGPSILAAKGLTVEVPAGIFRDVIRVDFKNSGMCADAGVGSQWYARGVGIVQWEEITFAGPRRYKLVKAVVDGKIYPDTITVTKGVSFTGTIDNYTYMVDMEPPGQINPVLTFQMSLANNSNAEIKMVFPSSQIYDAVLYDVEGKEMTRWSFDKAFAAVITPKVLPPGETLTVKDSLELWNSYEDRPLEAGDYRIELILKDGHWKTVLDLKVTAARLLQ